MVTVRYSPPLCSAVYIERGYLRGLHRYNADGTLYDAKKKKGEPHKRP